MKENNATVGLTDLKGTFMLSFLTRFRCFITNFKNLPFLSSLLRYRIPRQLIEVVFDIRVTILREGGTITGIVWIQAVRSFP